MQTGLGKCSFTHITFLNARPALMQPIRGCTLQLGDFIKILHQADFHLILPQHWCVVNFYF